MKKLLSVVLAIAMLTGMSVTAFATNWDPNPGNVRDQSGNPDVVPMYGYVGPVVENPTDPDPEDPNVNPWALNISVPVKFIWAAFNPDDGSVTPVGVESPDYKIINYGDYDVDITVTKFNVINPLASVDGSVTLELANTGLTSSPATGIPLPNTAILTGTLPAGGTHLGTLAAKDDSADTDEWNFTIGGTYTPNTAWPETVKLPEYKVEFTFVVKK